MRETDFNQLIKTLKGKRVPFSVVFELTKRCNLRCLHCYLPDGRTGGEDELDLTEIRTVLDDLAKAGCLKLTLTGENLPSERIFERSILTARRKGLPSPSLQTGHSSPPESERFFSRPLPWQWSAVSTGPPRGFTIGLPAAPAHLISPSARSSG